jgi:alkylation response protein AidB-like acyl-CoA dehydrogenase
MAIREYAVEAMLYRTAGFIDATLQGSHASAAVLAALEEYAIEASILKVAASEMLDFVLDENVQIHGGNGFVKDYPAERHYRDARVNRIFEGTNEINRLLVPGMLARRAVKGGLPLIPAARKLQDELLTPTLAEPAGDGPLANAQKTVTAMKKIALMVLGTAMQSYGESLADQQEVLSATADIIIDVYAAESALLRAQQASTLHADAAAVFVNDAANRVEMTARNVLAAMTEGDSLRTLLAALRRFLKVTPVNTVVLRRRVADAIAEKKGYPF